MTTSKAVPLVSVVMPSHNHRRFVEEAIRSVYEQTYRPIELIVIDDGSSDGSSDVIRQFLAEVKPPAGISVHFSTRENRGVHATINEAVSLASGNYIAILNSDHAYEPERIDRCVATASASDSRLIFSYVDAIDAEGLRVEENHPWLASYRGAQREELTVAPCIGFMLLKYNVAVTTGNLFFRRDLYDLIGGFGNYRYTHGLDFLIKALEFEEPILIRQYLYRYRLHDVNACSASSEKVDAELEQIFRGYLTSVLVKAPPNPVAPTFANWPASMGAIFGQPGFNRAIDSLIETTTAASHSEQNGTVQHRRASRLRRAEVTLMSHELSRTGAPTLALEVAHAMTQAGASVNLISISDGPLRAEFEQAGIPVTVAHDAMHRKLMTVARNLGSLSTRFQRWRILCKGLRLLSIAATVTGVVLTTLKLLPRIRRVLLINSFTAWSIALPVIVLSPFTRIIWYIHESYDPYLLLLGRSAGRLFRTASRRKNVAFLYGSDATRRLWARFNCDGQVRYWSGLPGAIPNPGSAKRGAALAGAHQIRRMVLSVGTSGPRKGTRVLIESFAYGRSRGLIGDDVDLVIVGCMPPSAYVETRDLLVRVHQPDLHGRVRLVGIVDRTALEAYYAEASVYVQSSTMECLPLALLTAMAHGLPIVTTDVDGCKEAILDGACGLTVPPRDIPRLAKAMGHMLANPAQAQVWGQAAQARFVRMFSLEATAEPLIKSVFPNGALRSRDVLATVQQ